MLSDDAVEGGACLFAVSWALKKLSLELKTGSQIIRYHSTCNSAEISKPQDKQ